MINIDKFDQLNANDLSNCIGGYCGRYGLIAYGLGGALTGSFYCTGYENHYREMQRNYGY
ncbi:MULTISPECIES: hypothetical protein [Streptococcus]|uniref:Uncharacterized protein n=1 Tax=Streptococcus downei MFe28 TaxID=764290 RepID=A0A380JFX5_STRDO|nr:MULTISPECIES: hypothetical protein [Streptococcus]OZV23712.1 hypothetical protein RO09_04400 [Streptococcus sobrinus]SUN36251.1 Uncharacterised protein [Streptococcus downei MFe28]